MHKLTGKIKRLQGLQNEDSSTVSCSFTPEYVFANVFEDWIHIIFFPFVDVSHVVFCSASMSLDSGCSVSIVIPNKWLPWWWNTFLKARNIGHSLYPESMTESESILKWLIHCPMVCQLKGIFLLTPLCVIKCAVLQLCIFSLYLLLLMAKGINSFLP